MKCKYGYTKLECHKFFPNDLLLQECTKKNTLRILDSHKMARVSHSLKKRVEVENGKALKELEPLNRANNPSIMVYMM